MKKKKVEDESMDVQATQNTEEDDAFSFPNVSARKKKKHKSKTHESDAEVSVLNSEASGIFDDTASYMESEESSFQLNDGVSKKKKKKKKVGEQSFFKSESEKILNNTASYMESEETSSQQSDDMPKKKRKKNGEYSFLKSEPDKILNNTASYMESEETSSQQSDDMPKKKKTKKKLEEPIFLNSEPEEILNNTASYMESEETSSHFSDDTPKKKKKKKFEAEENILSLEEEKKMKKMNGVLETNEVENSSKPKSDAPSKTWSKEKIDRLLNQIEAILPKNDNLKYTSRISKLDWEAVSFDDYSAEDCQEMWRHIQAKIRCYRILKEILDEARKDENKNIIFKKMDDHPEKPVKPLSSFMLYYKDAKDKVIAENPGINCIEISKKVSEMWKSLSPKKLEKYKSHATKLRQEYDEKLKKFTLEHPEINPKSKPDALGFTKPKSAFQLFQQAMREKHPSSGPGELLERCKTKWKNMSEKKKVVWIEAAQREEDSYREKLKKYEIDHPDYVAPPVKTLITKNDMHILNNLSGKPKKPPCNAYSLYSRESLQNGSLKEIPAKDRLAEISRRWKALTQDERDAYVARCEQMHKVYKIEYDKFMDSLPPEKKLEELEKMHPKRKRSDSKVSRAKKLKVPEPVPPPANEIELFKQKHQNEWNTNSLSSASDTEARSRWKKLSKSEKEEYSEELEKLKKDYVAKLTEYLPHCPPDKLAHYVSLIAFRQ